MKKSERAEIVKRYNAKAEEINTSVNKLTEYRLISDEAYKKYLMPYTLEEITDEMRDQYYNALPIDGDAWNAMHDKEYELREELWEIECELHDHELKTQGFTAYSI